MRPIAALLAGALLAAGCSGGAEPGSGDALLVVATTTILGDVASAVVGDDGRVETLMPAGADPHDFRPSSRQAALLARADLVIANGLGLEEGLDDTLASVFADGVDVLRVAPLVDPLPFTFGLGDVPDPAAAGDDPHVWMDPDRVADVAALLADRLDDIAPGGPWAGNAAAYAADLAAADAHIRSILAAVPPHRRMLVTSHGAFGYWAERYGFEIAGTVIPGGSTLADPSSAELADLVATMRAGAVTAIFTDAAEPAALAEAVAAELGSEVEVVALYTGSLGEPGSGADTLIGMLLTNAERIAGALA